MLRILSVAHPFAPVSLAAVSGDARVLALLDEHLVRAGHQSWVVAQFGSNVAGRLIAGPSRAHTLDATTRAALLAQYRESIARALRAARPHVVHLHGLDFAQYLPDTTAAVLVTLHHAADQYPRSAFARSGAAHFTCISEAQRRTAAQHCNVVATIPNGVALDAFSLRASKSDYALVLARVCPDSGIHLALDAAKRSAMRLLVAGDVLPYPEHRRYFREQIAPRLDADRVFLGPVCLADKIDLLARARCAVVASRVEQASALLCMEALACGTPVVALRRGVPPELIEHGRTGLVTDSADALATALGEVGRLRSADCRAAAERRFSAARMARAYLELYARLARRGPAQLARLEAPRTPGTRPAGARQRRAASTGDTHTRRV